MSIGAPEIIIVVLIVVVLFGATWAFKNKRSIKRPGGGASAQDKTNENKV